MSLIVIEGLDGSGKATQTKLLCEALERQGKTVKAISFPDYDSPSSSLIKMYLNGAFGEDPACVGAYAASSFYAVDRYASFIRSWREDYLHKDVIVADRYTTSNMIYQQEKLPVHEREEFLSWLEIYEYEKLGIPRPDLVLYLDMDPQISQNLLYKRYGGIEEKKDIHEKNIAFLQACRECALYAASRFQWTVVPCVKDGAVRPVEQIHEEIKKRILGAI